MQVVVAPEDSQYVCHILTRVPSLNLLEEELVTLQLPHIRAVIRRIYIMCGKAYIRVTRWRGPGVECKRDLRWGFLMFSQTLASTRSARWSISAQIDWWHGISLSKSNGQHNLRRWQKLLWSTKRKALSSHMMSSMMWLRRPTFVNVGHLGLQVNTPLRLVWQELRNIQINIE